MLKTLFFFLCNAVSETFMQKRQTNIDAQMDWESREGRGYKSYLNTKFIKENKCYVIRT